MNPSQEKKPREHKKETKQEEEKSRDQHGRAPKESSSKLSGGEGDIKIPKKLGPLRETKLKRKRWTKEDKEYLMELLPKVTQLQDEREKLYQEVDRLSQEKDRLSREIDRLSQENDQLEALLEVDETMMQQLDKPKHV